MKNLLIAALILIPVLALAGGLSPVGTSIQTQNFRCVVLPNQDIECVKNTADCQKARQAKTSSSTIDEASGQAMTLNGCVYYRFPAK